jgi:NADP-dependent 3-hydroxy acid dehydrogenase YdfG
MNSLTDRVAVVTGASSGVGRAIALELAAAGAAVCLIGRNSERLAAVARSASTLTRLALSFSVDLTQDEEVASLTTQLRDQVEHVDILAHCAAEYTRGTVEQASMSDFDLLYRANLRAPYSLTQQLLPLLKIRGGQVVYINSTAGLDAPGDVSQYSATKHGLRALADSLRKEVNDDGIRVLSVFLGRTATPLQARIYAEQGLDYEPDLLVQPEDVASLVVSALQLPARAEVTEIRLRPAKRSYK